MQGFRSPGGLRFDLFGYAQPLRPVALQMFRISNSPPSPQRPRTMEDGDRCISLKSDSQKDFSAAKS
ncbi:hypothetical protein DEV91_104264 [Phyllobacterium brassicacearum]|nr:hypothetical protein DEV91_104264 [Phyllobacterium brassicacearum]